MVKENDLKLAAWCIIGEYDIDYCENENGINYSYESLEWKNRNRTEWYNRIMRKYNDNEGPCPEELYRIIERLFTALEVINKSKYHKVTLSIEKE